MPINSDIALQGRPVQFDIQTPINLMNQGRQMLMQQQQLQMERESHAQRMQLGQQELQQNQLRNQMQQQAMAEDAAVRDAYGKSAVDGTGLEGMRAMLAGKVSPQRMAALDKEILGTQEAMGKVKKGDLENAQTQNTMVADTGAALLRMAPDQRAAAWPSERARLIQQGAITADHAPEQYPGDDWLQMNVDHALHADTQFTQEMKRREDTRAAAEETRKVAAEAQSSLMRPEQFKELQAKARLAELEASGQSPIQPAQEAAIKGAAEGRAETRNYHAQRIAIAEGEHGPTGGQTMMQQRFEQRRKDAAAKDMQAVQAKENEVHAARLKLGEELKDPTLPAVQRQAKMAQMKSTAFQVQSFQSRKATIAGAQVPPQAIQDKIPEGHQMPTPDGHVWQKQGGIVYFVK